MFSVCGSQFDEFTIRNWSAGVAIPLKYNLAQSARPAGQHRPDVLSIALVVAIFVGVMALANGLETILVSTGEPETSWSAGGLRLGAEQLRHREGRQALVYLPGVAAAPDGEPLASPEIVVIINLPKVGGGEGENANVTVRGISRRACCSGPSSASTRAGCSARACAN